METRRHIFGGLILAAVALLCLAGCKKDEEGEKVVLGVDFEQTAGTQKTYIGNGEKTIYWSTDDNVQVNGTNYLVHDGVVEVKLSDDGYAAVYPKTATLNGTGKTCTGGTVVIPATQEYTVDANGVQRLDAPMAARLDSKTGRLLFRNLYAVVKVTVTAKATESFTLSVITIESANGKNLSGAQSFTFSGSTTDVNNIRLGDHLTNGSTCVTLMFNTPVTIPAGGKDSFYLYTVPFSGTDLTVRLNWIMTDHPATRRTGVNILRSQLRSTTVDVGNIQPYVDLGLIERWAPCNVGAGNAGENGIYFAWGETTGKTEYSWASYKYVEKGIANPGPYNMTKYSPTDGLETLQLEDDAAAVNWGNGWRMPTEEEFDELITECSWCFTTNYLGKGISGYIVAGKGEERDKSIFLPAAGFYDGTSLLQGCFYWSSSLNTGITKENNRGMAKCLFDESLYNSGLRHCGTPIRAVMNKPAD